jgi:hypothetical protein
MIDKISFIKFIVLASLAPTLYFSFNPGEIIIPTLLTMYPSLLLILVLIYTERITLMDEKKTVLIFVLYGAFTFARGLYDAKSFQDWTNLLSISVSNFIFFPLTIYLGAHKKFAGPFIRILLIAIPMIFILTLGRNESGPYGFVKTLSATFPFLLMFPYLNKKLKVFVVLILFLIVGYDITIRASLMYGFMIILSLSTYYIKRNEILVLFKILRRAFLFLPLFFAFLGATGTFNVFNFGENFDSIELVNEEKNQEQDLLVDSRSGIFNDVHTSLLRKNSVLFGLGGVGKTKTFLTKNSNQVYRKIYEEGRRATEARILNYYQWGGVIGVFFYFSLILRASYLAIYRSKNWYMITLGLFVSFGFVMSFIADRTIYNLNTLSSFFMLGMCLNRELRAMNEREIKTYLRTYLKGYSLIKKI